LTISQTFHKSAAEGCIESVKPTAGGAEVVEA
jgi:hypothetical protein